MKIEKIYLLIVFIVPVLIGIILLYLTKDYLPMNDAVVFINGGKEVAYHGWGNYGMYKEPGYPFLLSFPFHFFKESTAIIVARVLNLLLQAGSAVVFVLILQMIKPLISKGRLIVYGLIFGCSPQLLTFSSLRVYSEPLQLFLNSIMVFCFIKIAANMDKNSRLLFWIIGGLATSLLIMTKVFFLLYPIWIVVSFIGVSMIIRKNKVKFIRKLIKPALVFLVLCYTWPFLWSLRNYNRYGLFMVSIRGATTMLSHTYLVEMETKDSLKWAVYQLSDSLGEKIFPEDKVQMQKQTGDAYSKAEAFAQYGSVSYGNSEISAVEEGWRLVETHPYKYILFTGLNSLNHVFFEGVYPDIYPSGMANLMRYVYLFNAVVTHFLYSLFIWFVILVGGMVYFKRIKEKGIEGLNLNYIYIMLPLSYFIVIAYHFHTEIRYLHPLYPNIYLLFCLSLNYWFDKYKLTTKQKYDRKR